MPPRIMSSTARKATTLSVTRGDRPRTLTRAPGGRTSVASGMAGRLFGAELPAAHHLLHEAVVGGQLAEGALLVAIGAGVAHVHHGEVVLAVDGHEGQGGERRPHAPQSGLLPRHLPHRVVGLAHGVGHPVGRPLPGEGGLEGVDRRLGGRLAADVSTHAVGHGEDAVALERPVLVGRPHEADVGGRAGPQADHGPTSRTVRPTWSRSPGWSGTGEASFLALTKVPLVEPRSSIQVSPLRRNTRAWSWEVKASFSATPQPDARPTVTSSPRSKIRPRPSAGSSTLSRITCPLRRRPSGGIGPGGGAGASWRSLRRVRRDSGGSSTTVTTGGRLSSDHTARRTRRKNSHNSAIRKNLRMVSSESDTAAHTRPSASGGAGGTTGPRIGRSSCLW